MTAKKIILIAAPEILSIPIQECNEPMINLNAQTIIKVGPSPEIPNNTNYTLMRKTVYQKLVEAQSKLPQGLTFCLYECYRSLQLQKTLFDQYYQKMQSQHSTYSSEQIHNETIKLISPVENLDGSTNIPPHSTGSAVDVYLVDEFGDYVDMGIHPQDWIDDLTGALSQTNSSVISSEAQKNRDIMSNALSPVGFINYPTEYWHWSYGDRYWAYHVAAPHAIYGAI